MTGAGGVPDPSVRRSSSVGCGPSAPTASCPRNGTGPSPSRSTSTWSSTCGPAGRSDALADTVDYGAVTGAVAAVIAGQHVRPARAPGRTGRRRRPWPAGHPRHRRDRQPRKTRPPVPSTGVGGRDHPAGTGRRRAGRSPAQRLATGRSRTAAGRLAPEPGRPRTPLTAVPPPRRPQGQAPAPRGRRCPLPADRRPPRPPPTAPSRSD